MQPGVPPQPPKRKGKVLIILGVIGMVLAVVGGGAAAVIGVMRASDEVDSMARVDVSTGGTVELDRTGTYNLYIEGEALYGDDLDEVPGLKRALSYPRITGPDGEPVTVRGSFVSESYDFGDHAGFRIGEFTVREPGRYQLTGIDARVDGAELRSFAVGRGALEAGLVLLGVGILGGFVVGGISFILLIIGLVMRSRSRKAQVAWGGGYPGAGGYAPAWGAPSGPGGWSPPPNAGSGPGGWTPPPNAGSGPGGWTPPPAAPGGSGTWAPPPVQDPAAPSGWTPPSASAPAGPSSPAWSADPTSPEQSAGEWNPPSLADPEPAASTPPPLPGATPPPLPSATPPPLPGAQTNDPGGAPEGER